jgi:hypothetical protein
VDWVGGAPWLEATHLSEAEPFEETRGRCGRKFYSRTTIR